MYYQIGPLPLWVDYELDLLLKFSASLGAGVTDYKGFQNKTYVTLGVGYEDNKWYPINDVHNEFTPISYSSVHGSTEIRLDLYPSIDFKLYSVVGPFFEMGPYLKYVSKRSTTNNRDQLIAAGLDARVGVLAGILGYDFLKFSWLQNLLETEIWKSPTKLELVDGNEQTANVGVTLPLPVKVRVLTSKDEPVNDMPVYFRPLQGSVSNELGLTDEQGFAQANWTLSQTPGIHRMEVFLKNGADEEMHEMKLDIRATAEAVTVIAKPTVFTITETDITQTSAILNGNVASDGGATITERGFFWSATITNPGPTTGGTKVTVSGTTGPFSYPLSGLQANTPYYYAAFAVNSQGTGTGEVQNFTTSSSVNPSGTVTDSRDGNVYNYVQIGSQVWMAENLAYLPSVSKSSNGSTSEPHYYVHGYNGSSITDAKNTSNYTTYGALYNWSAAMNGATSSNSIPSEVKGICPDGWHLPSNAEFQTLVNYLGGSSIAGGKMKSVSYWDSPNTGADNSSGFTALPGGSRYNTTGVFANLGFIGNWWSSTENSNLALCVDLRSNTPQIRMDPVGKDNGFSVRCLRDF